MKRALRLIQIISLLHERPRTVGELADHFAVTERTIYRDLADLSGEPQYAPIVCDRVMIDNSYDN